jgi:hypothetical protein
MTVLYPIVLSGGLDRVFGGPSGQPREISQSVRDAIYLNRTPSFTPNSFVVLCGS